jgi:hypothetical protein
MTSAGFEPATPANKRQQTYALERADAEVGLTLLKIYFNIILQYARGSLQLIFPRVKFYIGSSVNLVIFDLIVMVVYDEHKL